MIKYFQKYEKLKYKQNKLKLDIDFLNNCRQLSVYLKFLTFKLPNVSNKDALTIRKKLFCIFFYYYFALIAEKLNINP